MDKNYPTLLIPDKPDSERDAVAEAWQAAGGQVLRIARFWDPPDLPPDQVRVYGNDAFCLVLQQKLGLYLVSPADELILTVPHKHLQRRLALKIVADLTDADFPTFAKPVTPKAFQARVYQDKGELVGECRGLDGDCAMILSEPVTFAAEARAFVLDREILDCAIYEGEADVSAAQSAVDSILQDVDTPRTVVMDVGLVAERGWALIEFNPVWGAGLNRCCAARVLPAIAAASGPRPG